MIHDPSFKKGFSVVEVIVAAAIIAIIVTGVASAWQFYLRMSGESTRLAQAILLAEEGAEALQYLRDMGWDANIQSLTPGVTYYLIRDATDYEIVTTPTLIDDKFYRTVEVSTVYRDTFASITDPSGTEDQNSKLATVSVYPATTTVPALASIKTYVFNEFSN